MSSSIAEAYSIFQQPWWLDATAPGQWDEVQVEEGGETVARLPFTIREKFGFRMLGQPALTQTLGPWLVTYPGEREDRRLAREKDLFTKLIKKLPRNDVFRQNFSPELTNWLPFYWQGFSQTTRYTYTLDLHESPEALLAHMSKSARKRITKASKMLEVVPSVSLDPLQRLSSLTFARQGLQRPYSQELLQRIDDAATRNSFRCLTVARDPVTLEEHAAAYAVGDASRVYMLVSGADPALRASGAGYATKWAALEQARHVSGVFDFEGSMIEGVEQFNRSLGGTQTPYSQLTSSTSLGSSLLAGRHAAGAAKHRLSLMFKSGEVG